MPLYQCHPELSEFPNFRTFACGAGGAAAAAKARPYSPWVRLHCVAPARGARGARRGQTGVAQKAGPRARRGRRARLRARPPLRPVRGCPHVCPRLDGDALLRQQRPMHMTTRPHKRAVALKLPQVLYISYRDASKRSGARPGGPGTCCKAPAWPPPHAAPGARCRSGALKRATKVTAQPCGRSLWRPAG